MKKIAYIILNYQTYWETISCIESIIENIGIDNLRGNRQYVIVVDNGSTNESAIEISRKYNKENWFKLIENRENLGFARGNNLGFEYAKYDLEVDFIILINSDIIFNDYKFVEKLNDAYEQKEFAVAGPRVCIPNGEVLNPCQSLILTLEDVKKRIEELKKNILICNLRLEIFYIGYHHLFNKEKRNTNDCESKLLNLSKGEQLHGCFLIFSPKYICKFDGIYDETFLYGEEILLRLRCIRSKLDMYYLSEISAIHNESRTEKYIGGNLNRRHKRRYINSLNSMKCIYDYMNSDKV